MMMSPESYIISLNGMSYEELLNERESLLKSIKEFENGDANTTTDIIDPSPDTRYQCNLLYLSKLCELIVDKYQKQNRT